MNSTTAPARPARLPWRADLLTALLGTALQAVAAFSVVIASGLTSGAGRGGADRARQIMVLGFGSLACLTLLVALLLRAKAPITAALHLLLSAALLLAVLAAPPAAKPPARRPAPSPSGTR